MVLEVVCNFLTIQAVNKFDRLFFSMSLFQLWIKCFLEYLRDNLDTWLCKKHLGFKSSDPRSCDSFS